MTGFLSALVLFLLVAVVVLGLVLMIALNRTNERRMLALRHGDRLPVQRTHQDSCCFEVPCSAKCADRRQTLMIAGAVEAARSSEGLQQVLTMADQINRGGWPPAMPGAGDAGHPAA